MRYLCNMCEVSLKDRRRNSDIRERCVLKEEVSRAEKVPRVTPPSWVRIGYLTEEELMEEHWLIEEGGVMEGEWTIETFTDWQKSKSRSCYSKTVFCVRYLTAPVSPFSCCRHAAVEYSMVLPIRELWLALTPIRRTLDTR
ncbi:hypothetical protein EVAR_46608_1 [Eumeta japonica]|uniref:Uncharacterized protein n=1 Tax=Eumeta variegata TaxID=151549 RepID=A0A4C1ZBI9_EUMVA|nr:hypothetical protein EVAR_46608_1 [Eumeta japonica]